MSLKFTSLGGLIGFGNASIILPLGPGDPDFNSVSLLLPFEGADGDTFTTDLSPTPKTMVFLDQSQIDTGEKKFGASSLQIDGSDEIRTDDHADFEFAAGLFTIECHVRWNTTVTATNVFVSKYKGATSDRSWRLDNTATDLRFIWSTDGLGGGSFRTVEGAWAPVADTWYHVAVDRDEDTVRIYVDGVVIATLVSSDGIDNNTSSLYIADTNDLDQNMGDGWIDNVRITKGVARYRGAFTPPTAPYPTRQGDPVFGHWAYTRQSRIDGGTTSVSYNVIPLNTELTNDIVGAKLSANQLTLPAGTYYIEAWAHGFSLGSNKLLIWNDTDSAFLLTGHSGRVYEHALCRGRFTLAATKTIEVQHYATSAEVDFGFGVASSSGFTETYAQIIVWKES